MIIDDTNDVKAVHNLDNEDIIQCSMKDSAKAFHILSTSLYSDNIVAILRELGCNARDSHVLAKQNLPWRLHLPTLLEPYFEIEDFGVGISQDEMQNIFTVFFESTKTQSQDFVGTLGLGSKSPFSYSDNFTIITKKDGVQNTYSAFKDDVGIPSVVRLDSRGCGSESGVLIRIAVKANDISAFCEKAKTVYSFFDVLPVCNILTDTDFDKKIDQFTEFNTKLFYENTNDPILIFRGRSTGIHVIMGGIKYPVECDRAEFDKFKYLFGYKFVMNAEIGEVNFMPSREGLTYNPKTVKFIQNQLLRIENAIAVLIDKLVDESPTAWSKASAIAEFGKFAICANVVPKLQQKYFSSILPTIRIPHEFFTEHEISWRIFTLNSAQKYVSNPQSYKSLQISPRAQLNDDVFEQLFLIDDQNTRVIDIKNSKSEKRYQKIIFYAKQKESLKHLEQFFTAKPLEKVSKYVRKNNAESLKTAYYSFYMHSRGYHNPTLRMRQEYDFDIINTSKVQFYVETLGRSIVAPLLDFKYVSTVNNALDPEVSKLIRANIKQVIAIPRSAKVDRSKFKNLHVVVEEQIKNEIFRIEKDPDELLSASIQIWADKENQLSHLKLQALNVNNIKDKVLAKMVNRARGNNTTFKYLSYIKTHPKLIKSVSINKAHLEKFYFGLSFSTISNTANCGDKATKIINALFDLETAKENKP